MRLCDNTDRSEHRTGRQKERKSKREVGKGGGRGGGRDRAVSYKRHEVIIEEKAERDKEQLRETRK